MRNFRWVAFRLFLGVLGVQAVSASNLYDDKLDPEKISRLQIPLSTLQMLWENKNLYYDERSQYYLTREPKLWQGNLYMFSIYNAENYGPYFTNLKNPQYGHRILTPITVRIWGKSESEKKDFYIGTYDFHHRSLQHFRFHIITIEASNFKKFPKNVG
ncbi:hypothetical protein IM40_00615 [Candidatus Paracaedimonas acanthamoebae]|nr:hypothetical protein IM40_00615 [Candidatus Paracaedimonas acanthamoebae]